MVMMKLKKLSATKHFYLLGLVGVLAIIPALFKKDHCSDMANSSFLVLVKSNNFENFILITLASSIPSVLDLIADLFQKEENIVYDDAQLSRIILAASLVFVPLLLLEFSINKHHLIATYAILNMRVVCGAAVIFEQLYKCFGQIYTFRWTFLILLLWVIGTVVRSYTTSVTDTSDSLCLISKTFRYLGGFLLIICPIQYCIKMRFAGEKVVLCGTDISLFEVGQMILPITSILFIVAMESYFSVVNIYHFSEGYVLGVGYYTSFFFILYSFLNARQFRFDLVVAVEKLSVKRQFVRFVSHEVRTPLNSCVLGLEYLKNMCSGRADQCSGDILTILDEILDSCTTAIDFMNNLLMYEKIDTLDLTHDFKVENLREICKKSFQSFTLSARHLNIDFQLFVHDSIVENGTFDPCVKADYSKLNVVFRNLISNAFKFSSPSGKVKLSLIPVHLPCGKDIPIHRAETFPSSPSETTHFRVIVEDCGIGLTEAQQTDLFKRVVQFNPNESQSGGGSGLGLFLSQKIVKDHGSVIQVYSEGVKGQGSKFYIDIPRYKDHKKLSNNNLSSITTAGKNNESESLCNLIEVINEEILSERKCVSFSLPPILLHEVSTMKHASVRTLSKPLHEIHILVVDDSSMNRKMLIRTFKQNNIGALFTEASDGVELLNLVLQNHLTDNSDESIDLIAGRDRSLNAIYKVHPEVVLNYTYDIIMVDKSMLIMNGDVAAFKLRELGYNGIIFGITGNALEEDLEQFCEMGVDYAFPKPFKIDSFLSVILKQKE